MYHFFTGAVITALVIITLCLPDVSFGAQSSIRRQLQDVSNFENEIAVAKSIQVIKVREYARMAFGILEIIHTPAKREITVILDKGRNRCPNPSLLGRLSGRALVLLQWEEIQDNIIRGYYDVPVTGPFFLEIIILFCNYDHRTMDNCMIPPTLHRITGFEAEIVTEISTPLKGYWSANAYDWLKTRWQPIGCRENMDKDCREKTSMWPFRRYSFVTEDPYIKKGLSTVNYRIDWKRESKQGYNCFRDSEDRCKACTIGASHSSRLSRFLSTAVGLDKIGNAKVQFPKDMNETQAQYIMGRCENIIVGFGQHNIKFGKTLPGAFADEMRRLLSLFSPHPRVFVRSTHYNPLGDEKIMCPPEDGRNPYLIDKYNIALSEVCKEFGIPYIDTRLVDGPMWDSGEDWNHLDFTVEIVHAFYIAQVVGLQDSLV